jgi:hypothetical protein
MATLTGKVTFMINDTDGSTRAFSGDLANLAEIDAPAPPPDPTVSSVQVAVNPATVNAGATAQCSATVEGTGSFSSAVTWSASAGTISADGVFTAPAAAGPVTITATSTQDKSKSGSATIVVQAVVAPPPTNSGEPVIPANAKTVNLLTPPHPWQGNHDPGTAGDASGTTAYPVTSPDGRTCRQFKFTTSGKGGMIYHTRALDDVTPYNCFCYKVRTKKVDPGGWATLGQAETDMEATNPKTGIPYDMAMQQSANSGQEEITINHHWTPTGIKLDPSKRDSSQWQETWNYVKLNADNTITYRGVNQSGVYYPINQTVTDPDSSPWGKGILNVQFQLNGKNAAPTDHEVLADLFEIDCWKE